MTGLMSNCPFCNLDPAPSPSPIPSAAGRPPGLVRRAWGLIEWLLPVALLAFLPKCPMCVAAYVALVTGLGISIATARWIRILLLVSCVTALAYLALRKALQTKACPSRCGPPAAEPRP